MHPHPRPPFQCPHCGGVFQIPPDLAGQAVACPHCNGGVLIPETASTTAPNIPQAPVPSAAAEPPQSIDPWQPPSSQPPMPAPSFAPTLGRTSEIPVSEPPVVMRPEPVEPPPMVVQSTNVSPVTTLSAMLPNEPQSVSRREFVIPTIDGGQATIREPVKTVTAGRKQRQLRDMNSQEKATRRWIKNVVVASFCAGSLTFLMWWLLS